jgi:AGCS family alanine or glycine:cation symporter
MLIVVGVYFTYKTKFVQFSNIKEMFKLLGEGTSSKGKAKNKGQISSFQAFCIGTASRVGTGNLAGVASAIAIALGTFVLFEKPTEIEIPKEEINQLPKYLK